MSDIKPFQTYIHTIEKNLAAGNATEHTHRPALKTLVEELLDGVIATNEPKRIECGAPDFIINKRTLIMGYIEAKDVDISLDEAEKSDQLKRYKLSLSNLILTDYIEFRWYVDGQCRLVARLGTVTKKGKIKPDKEGIQNVSELFTGFLSHQTVSVGKPKDLAVRMAHLAHMIRDLIINTFEKEPDAGSLHSQLAAFRESLIPGLDVKTFADMYAQTIAYGLFAARCTAYIVGNFTRFDAAQNLPKTNPFLRKLFQYVAGYELDERIAWLVDDLAQVLAQADMVAVREDFGTHTGKDPVVHFYETFLKEYSSEVREMRGVYYTPQPVVSYIVRSIDYLLKTRFAKPQGLADPSVLILDPAVGTATFLYEAINEIHNAVISQGQQGTWNNYVGEKLLPRLFGFELLMAPYAIAHLKLELLLQETNYQFQSDQRLGIYLTNTLEEGIKKSEKLAGFNEYIVEEANAAAEIKKTKPIMVVLGNPPYSGMSANASKHIIKDPKTGKEKIEFTWIGKLIEDYKIVDGHSLGEKNPKWLQDDYVKFLRFGQWRINLSEKGVLGFITNHSYLDNPTFRGMRQSLMNTFTDIYILNLHGNSKRKEVSPDRSKDENVFDIQQGVAISIFIKETGKNNPAVVHYSDLWGSREGKYQSLSETDVKNTEWKELNPNSPSYLFVPQEQNLLAEYEKGWKVTDIFPVNSVGIVTARDELSIKYSKQAVEDTIEDFVSLSAEEAREKYQLGEDARDWKVSLAQKDLNDSGLQSGNIVPIIYRPFDIRYTYYTGNSRGFHCMPRGEVMKHMLAGENIGLISARSNKSPDMNHFFCTHSIMETKCGESTTQSCLFPLYLYPTEGEMQLENEIRRPNLNPEFIKTFSEKLGLKFVADGKGDLVETFGPEDIFNYAYAVFHSPTYRTRYAEFLKMDFPRLPLTSSKELFKVLAEKGAALVALHLMESPLLNTLITKYPVPGTNIVENVRAVENVGAYGCTPSNDNEKNLRVYINKDQYFEGVPPEVWNFHIGGYQVCQKWLKDRKGITLTDDASQHYQKIIMALKETIRLMAEIDQAIPGWPVE